MKRKDRMEQMIYLNREHVEKYASLSEEHKQTVNTVTDRLLEMEKWN